MPGGFDFPRRDSDVWLPLSFVARRSGRSVERLPAGHRAAAAWRVAGRSAGRAERDCSGTGTSVSRSQRTHGRGGDPTARRGLEAIAPDAHRPRGRVGVRVAHCVRESGQSAAGAGRAAPARAGGAGVDGGAARPPGPAAPDREPRVVGAGRPHRRGPGAGGGARRCRARAHLAADRGSAVGRRAHAGGGGAGHARHRDGLRAGAGLAHRPRPAARRVPPRIASARERRHGAAARRLRGDGGGGRRGVARHRGTVPAGAVAGAGRESGVQRRGRAHRAHDAADAEVRGDGRPGNSSTRASWPTCAPCRG